MNQKVAVAFLLVAVTVVLAHPGIARDDAIAPAVVAADAAAVPPVPDQPTIPEQPPVPDQPTIPEQPPVPDQPTVPEQPAVPSLPEELPTSPSALFDDVTSVAVTLPAEQEGSLPAAEGGSNDNVASPNAINTVV